MPAPPAVPCPPSASRSAAAPTAPGRTTTPAPPSCSTCSTAPPSSWRGTRVITAERGNLVLVPPGLAHAFAAAPGHDADIFIVITPGVERFEYFRHLERIAYGKQPPESLLEVQELYDTYFQSSAPWNQARALSAPLPDSADVRESSRGRSE